MKTEIIKTSKLNNNTGQVAGLPKNPRFLKDDKFLKLKKSIEQDPEMLELREVLAYDNGGELVVIGGNMRLRACKELGIKEVPCKILPKETPIEKLKAYTIKDNSSFGDWDFDLLANEWDAIELEEWGVEIPEMKIDNILTEDDDFEIGSIGDKKTDIVLGDLFEIGPHKLLCGDSTDSDQVAKLFNGKIADLYITDPPYGVSYSEKNKALNKFDGGNRIENDIENDSLSLKDTKCLWDDVFLSTLPFLSKKASYYIFSTQGGELMLSMMNSINEHFILKHILVWNKNNHVLGRCDYSYKHEPIFYGWGKGGTHEFYGGFKTSVLDFDRPQTSDLHPTMKPVELIGELIQNSSKEGDLCYDSFLGSGTTLVACYKTNRIGYGIEIDPKYCQVIVDRMRKLDSSLEVKKNGVKI